jgi:hypothetical protein
MKAAVVVAVALLVLVVVVVATRSKEEPQDTDPVDTDAVVQKPVDTDTVIEDPVDTDPVIEDPVDTDPVIEDPVDTDPIDPIDEDSTLLTGECTGYWKPCARVDGQDYAVSSFVQTGGDCNDEELTRTCKKCSAVLGDCDAETGLKTYQWADSEYDYSQNATDRYWCPEAERSKIGTTEAGLCTKCTVSSVDECKVDSNTGMFFRSGEILDEPYDYCPQSDIDLANAGSMCDIPPGIKGIFKIDFGSAEHAIKVTWEQLVPEAYCSGKRCTSYQSKPPKCLPHRGCGLATRMVWKPSSMEFNVKGVLTLDVGPPGADPYQAELKWVGPDGGEYISRAPIRFEVEDEQDTFKIEWQQDLENALVEFDADFDFDELAGLFTSSISRNLKFEPASMSPNDSKRPYVVWKEGTWQICLGNNLIKMTK